MADPVWKKLKHANGPAKDVPAWVEQLGHPKPEVRALAYRNLIHALVTPKQWHSASGPAVQVLLDAAARAGEGAHRAFWLATDIASGDHRTLLGQPKPAADKLAADAARARKSLLDRADQVLATAKSGEPRLRAAALQCLGVFPELASAGLPVLEATWETDAQPEVAATALLAFAQQTAWRKKGSPLTTAPASSGAVLEAVRVLQDLLLDEARLLSGRELELRACVLAEPDTECFPWFRGALHEALVALVQARPTQREQVTAALLEVPKDAGTTVSACSRAADVLLTLAEFKSRWAEIDIALPEELSSLEREVAEALATRDWLTGIGWGLPKSGRDRRRWLGQTKGALEKTIPDGAGKSQPAWLAWRTLLKANPTTSPSSVAIPPQVAEQLSPFEQLEASCEYLLDAYRLRELGRAWVEPEDIQALLEKLSEQPVSWAKRFADELVTIFAHAPCPESGSLQAPCPVELAFATLLPIVRSGGEVKEAWDALLPWSPAGLAREVLDRVPPARRERAIFGQLEPMANPNSNLGIAFVMPILDLVPSERIAQILVAKLKHPTVEKVLARRGELEPAWQRLHDLAKSEPCIKAALDASENSA